MKESSTKDISMVLFLGGVGTAFYLLFTDSGRELLDKFGVLGYVERLPTIADLVGESPYEFYPIPYPSAEGVPDYLKSPNPYLLQDQPYVYVGGDIPYVHPAAAREIMEDQPSNTYREPDPLITWLDKLFHGENK